MEKHKNKSVPIWEKSNLTLTEAAEYFNIGKHAAGDYNNNQVQFRPCSLNEAVDKGKEFEKYLEQVSVI